jgi:phosphatidylglycerophosphate synthase
MQYPGPARLNPQTARKTADALTWARIVSVVPITVLAWHGLEWWVFGVYIAAALTDFFDGWFARRGAPPATDTDLDGLADLLFTAATVLWLWMLVPGFISKYWLPYMPMFLLLQAYIVPLRARYPQLGLPHLATGRVTMAMFFSLLPALLLWGDITWFVHLVLAAGTAATAQLAVVIARRRKLLPDAGHLPNADVQSAADIDGSKESSRR